MVVDNTGSATLLMWNNPCTTLIGQTAAEMKLLHGECSESIPKVIEDAILDKRVLFEVRGSSFKNMKGAAFYTVSRLAYDEDIMALYTKNYTGTQVSTTDDADNMDENSNSSPDVINGNKRKLEKGKEKCCSEVGENEINDECGNDDEVSVVNDANNVNAAKIVNDAKTDKIAMVFDFIDLFCMLHQRSKKPLHKQNRDVYKIRKESMSLM
ncbi:hypothetical protein CASFOL_012311 [Castilleja foliolosa]|uniref:Uncharacterized protein n=1 Tax=Castilleja foliolosa TaxID=1961234 RepID=A0ABD3DU27_9LAMI